MVRVAGPGCFLAVVATRLQRVDLGAAVGGAAEILLPAIGVKGQAALGALRAAFARRHRVLANATDLVQQRRRGGHRVPLSGGAPATIAVNGAGRGGSVARRGAAGVAPERAFS